MSRLSSEKATTGQPDAARCELDLDLLASALEVHAHADLADQLDLLLERAVSWVGVECGFALAPGGDRATWSPIAATVPKDDRRRGGFGSVVPDPIRKAVDRGQRVFEGLGPFESQGVSWPGAVPGATVALPVMDQENHWAAVLALVARSPPAEERLERIERLLQLVRPAVSNAKNLQALRELVIKDDTAHCFNRRYFETSLPEELSRANRFHSSLSLIFLDMDNLKEINLQHGHSMGSRTLREVSRRIRLKIRRFDKLFRFGGDEFCIVLPETEWHGALEVAERVREAIASQLFLATEIEDSAGVGMTASLGIASFPLHARTEQELVEQADRAMQRVKSGTKNSIGIAEIVGGKHGS
jgi:diguanylate cyclase (GGDEF)-like protein